MRYVGYCRVSTDEQSTYSIDAQKRAIAQFVQNRGGQVAKFYVDEGFTGTNGDRPGLQALKRDAAKGQFDAVVVHKSDRLFRNLVKFLTVTELLKRDYGVSVLSVSEPLDGDDANAFLMRAIQAAIAEWYSRNLSNETKKGKQERARQGLHNNQAPFGYDKVDGKLVVNPHEAVGVLMAFQLYAEGKYSDADIAKALNEKGFRTKRGNPFSKETVRSMLQNRTYLGLVKYQPYAKNADGSRNVNTPVEWYEGQHQALVTEELFERCQEVREKVRRRRTTGCNYAVYPLSGLLYCGHCGRKMRGQKVPGCGRYYRCNASEWGEDCPTKCVKADILEAQVAETLSQVELPSDWREKVTNAIGDALGQENLDKRLKEIEGIIQRLDFRWDAGFIDKAEYLERRRELQKQLDALQPIAEDDLAEAANLLANFPRLWANADLIEKRRLVHTLVERIEVKDKRVFALVLRPSYYILTKAAIQKRKSDRVKDLRKRERRDSNPRSPA